MVQIVLILLENKSNIYLLIHCCYNYYFLMIYFHHFHYYHLIDQCLLISRNNTPFLSHKETKQNVIFNIIWIKYIMINELCLNLMLE